MLQHMIIKVIFGLCLVAIGVSESCYWNRECSYQLFGSKTPYDAIRGDIRDLDKPQICEAVSLWSLQRHGNRNPGSSVTLAVKNIAQLKDQIIAAYDGGRSQLCATDIDEFRKYVWNSTLDTSASYLTGVGYEELYDIGRRVRIAWPELMTGHAAEYYFRPTKEQRTITSAVAFVHGLTDGMGLNVTISEPREVENVIRPYENCDRYQQLVKNGDKVVEEVKAYESSSAYINVKQSVQQRLGISHQITTEELYSIYELCRFHRSWNEKMRSPWCAPFTDEDLVVLDYRDDVRHYYRNGHGSWVNVALGMIPMRDLYENLEAAVEGRGKKIISYFTHDTMMEMVYSALGLYKDHEPLTGAYRNPNRLWRSSFMGAMAINLMAVLNKCQESGTETYRVQIFVGEKNTALCPPEGCTWTDFQEMFRPFANASLDFCNLDYKFPDVVPIENSTEGVMVLNLSDMLLIMTQVFAVLFLR